MTKAFLAVEGGQAAASTRVHETVEKLTDMVVETLTRRQPGGGTFHIEDIQDQVELAMMRNGDQKIARAYVLYRELLCSSATLVAVKPPTKVADEHKSSLNTNYNVVRRNGKLTGFDKNKIAVAMTKAFLAVEGGQAAASTRVHETVEKLTDMVVETLTRRQPGGGTFHIEDIQDQVELAMMRNGDQKIARAYVLYREQRANARAQERIDEPEVQDADEIIGLNIKLQDGSTTLLDTTRLKTIIDESCTGLESASSERVYADTMKNLFDAFLCPCLRVIS